MASVDFHERRVEEIFSKLDHCHMPGGVVGIAVRGIPVFRRGYGLASMELPLILGPQTQMRIYSITKCFTCLAYLLLCEEGKANIDDPVGKYLPELHPVSRRVTMRQVMGNVSGLRDALEIRWFFSGIENEVSGHKVVDLYRDIEDVNFEPGAAWCYNNGGFQILSIAIERISEEPLEKVLRKRIFEPIGMHDTELRRLDTNFVRNSASMHTAAVCGGYVRRYLPGEVLGEGGVVSTVDDMLRWLSHMAKPLVGSSRTWEIMRTPLRLNNGTPTGYGLGLARDRYRGVEMVYHAGSGMGGNSQMMTIPELALDIVVIANRDDINSVGIASRALEACVLGLAPCAMRTAGRLSTGVFCSRTTGHVIELYEQEGRQMVSLNGNDMEFAFDCDGVLRPVDYPLRSMSVTLKGKRESPDSIVFFEFGRTDELVAEKPILTGNFAAIVGSYWCKATGTFVSISEDEGNAQMKMQGRFGSAVYRVKRLTSETWKVKAVSDQRWSAILRFDSKSDGFQFTTQRNWGLVFKRERQRSM